MRSILPMMFLLVVTTVSAEVYRWIDDEGSVHFSDTPREPGNTQRVDVDEINTAKSVEVESVTTDAVADDPADVVMYSASWCGTCDLAREYFPGPVNTSRGRRVAAPNPGPARREERV